MGQEIPTTRFTRHHFHSFQEHLRAETRLLGEALRCGHFAETDAVAGFELEAWLVDDACAPAPVNQPFLAELHNPLAVPELAAFNFEINGTPQPLRGASLSALQHEMEQTWRQCQATARSHAASVVAIGILPTVREEDLTLANMSPADRYRALNEQVLLLRQGRPLHLDISGRQTLTTVHHDVMVEAAATSFQIHMQIPTGQAVRYYNAAIIASAPMVAVSANSPFLFGRDLWDETRIPLFEQAVDVGAEDHKRVTFGTRYVQGSLYDWFEENLAHYPVLFPITTGEAPDRYAHLRLHNGTIWRWNRPLIGFGHDGRPHLRIEHRVVPAGPSLVDAIANAAFFFGLVHTFATSDEPPEHRLAFGEASANFYGAAREGLGATLHWLGGGRASAQDVIVDLLPLARRGLQQLGIDPHDRDAYLDIIEARARTGRTGAWWQRHWVARHGRDWAGLCSAYMHHQARGTPVHEWGA